MIALIVITFYYQVALIEPLSDALVAIVARSDFANVAIILCHILSVKKTRLFVCFFCHILTLLTLAFEKLIATTHVSKFSAVFDVLTLTQWPCRAIAMPFIG